MMAKLRDLLKRIDSRIIGDISNVEINKVTDDSRAVEDGDLFIAVRGASFDGQNFIKDAIRSGARAIMAEEEFDSPLDVMKIIVGDARKALYLAADNFFDSPSKKLKTIGITGTNGKTTITYLVEKILTCAAKNAGVIGTVDYRFAGRSTPAKNTTPGALEISRILADMAEGGVEYVAMEVSSHSLDQRRIDGISFDAAVFTNVTNEHLDYHKTLDNYFRSKARLLELLKNDGTAILNSDDDRIISLRRSVSGKKTLTYGLSETADIRAEKISLSLNGTTFRAVTPEGEMDIRTGLIGRHNVSNILASIAAAISQGIGPETIKNGIESFGVVPGRLEPVESGQPFRVYVDYAHTEDALYNILSLLKEVAKRRIITVFGCGGNRDRRKRPAMGRVACKFSDRVIITSDNPRFEEPRDIIDEIESGLKGKYSNYEILEDRREAVKKALETARDEDIVLIAGKGHEKYQIVKDRTIPFDDCEIAKSILTGQGYAVKRDSSHNKR